MPPILVTPTPTSNYPCLNLSHGQFITTHPPTTINSPLTMMAVLNSHAHKHVLTLDSPTNRHTYDQNDKKACMYIWICYIRFKNISNLPSKKNISTFYFNSSYKWLYIFIFIFRVNYNKHLCNLLLLHWTFLFFNPIKNILIVGFLFHWSPFVFFLKKSHPLMF